LPEEAEIKRIDAEIKRRQDIQETGGRISQDSRVGLLREFEPEAASKLAYFGSSDLQGNQQLQSSYDQEFDKYLLHAAPNKIRQLMDRQSQLKEQVINKRLDTAKQKQEALKSNLMGLRSEVTEAIDKQLAQMLEETGINAGQMRQATAGVMADRGLLRSSFANQGFSEVNATELEEKARLRNQGLQAKTGVQQTVDGTVETLERQREKAQFSRDLRELQSYNELAFELDVDSMKRNFEVEIANAQLKTDKEVFLKRAVGGILGGVARIFASGAGG
jgi:hypothetical protein